MKEDVGAYNSIPFVERRFPSLTLIIANCLSGALLFGLSMSTINNTKDFIGIEWQWCPYANGNIYTMKCAYGLANSSAITVGVLIGACIGSIAGGYIVTYGRLWGLYAMHGLFLLGNVLSGVAVEVVMLAIARIVLGFGLGLSTYCVPLFISEISPKARRGYFGVLFQLLITFGILLANVISLPMGSAPAIYVDPQLASWASNWFFKKWWWRFVLGIPSIFSAISILLHKFIFNFETPHFLIMSEKYGEAAALLRAIHNKKDVEEEYNEIKEAIEEARRQESLQISVVKALMNPYYRTVVLIGFTLSSFQQLTGINLIITNSTRMFQELRLGHIALYLTVAITAVNMLMTFPPIFMVDRFGRRTILLWGVVGQFIGVAIGFIVNLVIPTPILPAGVPTPLNVLGEIGGWISVVCTFIFIISFAVGYGTVPWIFLHEIFPAEIKQGASSTATAFNWLCAVIVVWPADYYLQSKSLFFGIFTVTNLIAVLFVYFFIKETKGLSIDESPYFKGKVNPETANMDTADKEGVVKDV